MEKDASAEPSLGCSQTNTSDNPVEPIKRPRSPDSIEKEARLKVDNTTAVPPTTAARGPAVTPPKLPVAKTAFKGPPSSRSTPLSSSSFPPTVSRFPTTPNPEPKTGPASNVNEKWVKLLLGVFKQNGETNEEKIKEVSERIVAALPREGQDAKDILLMLCLNLKDPENHELREKVLSGRLPPEVLVTLDEYDLINPQERKKRDAEFQERAKHTNLAEIENAQKTSSTLFACPRCKVRDCSFYEKQTRSGDEPMTVFCTCNNCGKRWKR